MNMSLQSFSHPASLQTYSTLCYRSIYPRLSSVLLGALILTSLEGCMQHQDEIERIQPMMGDSEEPDTDRSRAQEPEMTEPEVTEPEVTEPEVTEPELTEPELTEPEVTEPMILEICAPQPHIYHNRWSIAPRLKDWVDELAELPCTLASQELEPSITHLRGQARFGQVGEESCDDEGCWVTLPSTTRSWYESPDDRRGFLDSGELWVGVIDARRHLASGQVEAYLIASKIGHSALREIQRSWDERGHILRDRHSFNRQLWSDVTYTWSDDAITHVDFQDHINGSSGYTFDFMYDVEGRLSVAQVSSGMKRQESRWTYDVQGRPASVIRLMSNSRESQQPWLHQAWSYDDQGGLSAHTSLINPELLTPMMMNQMGRAALLDSYQPTSTMSQYDWDRQAAKIGRGNDGQDCLSLPTGVEIGYPSAEQVYDLGWPALMRPEGIDVAHGFQRIYRVGMLGWMSHFGAEGEYSPALSNLVLAQQIAQPDSDEPADESGVIRSVIRYQGLKAVSEELTSYSPEQVQLTDQAFVLMPDVEPRSLLERERVWTGDRLTRDQIEFSNGMTRTFSFTYDDEGRVTERSLSRGAELIARYTWAYHPDSITLPRVCQISGYHVGHNSQAITELWSDVLTVPGEDESTTGSGREDEQEFDAHASYTSTLEGALEGTCSQYRLSGPEAYELELSFDEQGRLTRQHGDVALSTFQYDHIEVDYHPDYDHISSLRTLDSEGQPSGHSHEYEIDDLGRLIAHSSSNHQVAEREEFVYECQP